MSYWCSFVDCLHLRGRDWRWCSFCWCWVCLWCSLRCRRSTRRHISVFLDLVLTLCRVTRLSSLCCLFLPVANRVCRFHYVWAVWLSFINKQRYYHSGIYLSNAINLLYFLLTNIQLKCQSEESVIFGGFIVMVAIINVFLFI